MPEKIHYNAEEDIIEVYAYDVVTKEEWTKDINIIHKLSEKHNCKKVLADIRDMTQAPPLHEIQAIGAAKLMNDKKYANLLTEDHPLAATTKFFEFTTTKKGVPLANFLSREKAILWLKTD
jgi:hypothetical protein